MLILQIVFLHEQFIQIRYSVHCTSAISGKFIFHGLRIRTDPLCVVRFFTDSFLLKSSTNCSICVVQEATPQPARLLAVPQVPASFGTRGFEPGSGKNQKAVVNRGSEVLASCVQVAGKATHTSQEPGSAVLSAITEPLRTTDCSGVQMRI